MKTSDFKNLLYFFFSMTLVVSVVACGGDDEDPDPTEECVTTDLTYTNYAKALLDNSCASSSCHSANNKDVIGSLENYDDVVDFVNDGFNLIGAINHEDGVSNMPKSGDKLEQCDIDKVTAWVNAGVPE